MTNDPDKEHRPGAERQKAAPDVFRHLLVGKLPNLKRFALSLYRNSHEAEDLVQATCERALSRWHQFEQQTRIESWLFAIMHSIWKNEIRKKSNQQNAYVNMTPRIVQTDGDREVFGKIELSEVLSALKSISTDQAAAITLVNLEGLSYREAAKVLDIPQGTLESRMARGRIMLGRLLDNTTTSAIEIPRKKAKSESLQ